MVQSNDNNLNKRAAEVLLDRLLEAVAELQDRIDKIEDKDNEKHAELKAEIGNLKAICDEFKAILDYRETIVSLGRNASSQGIIDLIRDVDKIKEFMNKQKERQELIWKISLGLAVPIFMFILGAVWYIFTHYLMK